MKLSEILETYAIIALNQFECVSVIFDDDEDDEIIIIQWNDSDEMDSYSQEFFDQEVEISKEPGLFYAITRQGEKVGFIAYERVDLYGMQEEPT